MRVEQSRDSSRKFLGFCAGEQQCKREGIYAKLRRGHSHMLGECFGAPNDTSDRRRVAKIQSSQPCRCAAPGTMAMCGWGHPHDSRSGDRRYWVDVFPRQLHRDLTCSYRRPTKQVVQMDGKRVPTVGFPIGND